MQAILEQFSQVAMDPNRSAMRWKEASGGKVVGTFAMHFPAEVIHASGALPVLLQADNDPITVGHAGMYPFFCSYTRSLVDQNAKGKFDYIDAIMFGDHCVQLLSAADIIRVQKPERHVGFHQLIPALKDNWSFESAEKTLRNTIEDLETQLDCKITDAALSNSISVFNRNRELIRRVYDLRRAGEIQVTSLEMQHIVKSSMVMDKAEHSALLEVLIEGMLTKGGRESLGGIPVFLSGHMCHAPKLELLNTIEECGTVVVDDDLYHGFRYVSINASEEGDPVKSLTSWYIDRNVVVPCPTRLDPEVDWDGWLLERVRASGAQGLVVLLPKFCEPHYFYYPRIKKTFEDAGLPHLLLETEHETMAGGDVRTRVEAFAEMIKQNAKGPVAA